MPENLEAPAEDEPVIQDVIDSSVIKPQTEDAHEPNPLAAENDEFEQLSNDIFENFGLCEQILDDFRKGLLLKEKSLTNDELQTRDRLVSALCIDSTLRRADFLKFYNDTENAKKDYQ